MSALDKYGTHYPRFSWNTYTRTLEHITARVCCDSHAKLLALRPAPRHAIHGQGIWQSNALRVGDTFHFHINRRRRRHVALPVVVTWLFASLLGYVRYLGLKAVWGSAVVEARGAVGLGELK
jgi:hypothetical protein